jgi:hypothetical protein
MSDRPPTARHPAVRPIAQPRGRRMGSRRRDLSPRPGEALNDGRLRHEERARDLPRRKGPHTVRSVNATCPSRRSAGWQQVNSSANRSSSLWCSTDRSAARRASLPAQNGPSVTTGSAPGSKRTEVAASGPFNWLLAGSDRGSLRTTFPPMHTAPTARPLRAPRTPPRPHRSRRRATHTHTDHLRVDP